jgi:hypothetical protein
MSWRFARNLRRARGTPQLVGGGWAAYGWTCLAGAVPGFLLLGVPPLLVAVTGLTFIPASFWLARRAVLRERGHIEALS